MAAVIEKLPVLPTVLPLTSSARAPSRIPQATLLPSAPTVLLPVVASTLNAPVLDTVLPLTSAARPPRSTPPATTAVLSPAEAALTSKSPAFSTWLPEMVESGRALAVPPEMLLMTDSSPETDRPPSTTPPAATMSPSPVVEADTVRVASSALPTTLLFVSSATPMKRTPPARELPSPVVVETVRSPVLETVFPETDPPSSLDPASSTTPPAAVMPWSPVVAATLMEPELTTVLLSTVALKAPKTTPPARTARLLSSVAEAETEILPALTTSLSRTEDRLEAADPDLGGREASDEDGCRVGQGSVACRRRAHRDRPILGVGHRVAVHRIRQAHEQHAFRDHHVAIAAAGRGHPQRAAVGDLVPVHGLVEAQHPTMPPASTAVPSTPVAVVAATLRLPLLLIVL